MKNVLVLAMLSSFVMAVNMSGWNNSQDEASIKAEKEEKARMCTLYTKKIKKYKETMRDDGLAVVTLNNYIRLQKKYCHMIDNNTSKHS